MGDPGSGGGRFGAALRLHRERASLSQEELAHAAGLGTRTIRELERGAVTRPHPRTLRALARALALDGDDREAFVRLARPEAPITAPHEQHEQHERLPVPFELPPDVADFTGRAAELAELTRALRAAGTAVPVAVVCGPAGCGKTTLAVRAAHLLRRAYPDGILFEQFRWDAEAQTAAAVLGRFLRSLGVPEAALPAGEAERSAALRSRLAGRRLLIVLDDVRDEGGVVPLLPSDPSCAVLVTSRSRLPALAGRLLVDLGLLTADEALDLLRRIVGDERVDAAPQAARDIVEACGFLPLALRIAGARLAGNPHWDLEDFARVLADHDRRLDALQFEHLGVRVSIAVSARHLSPGAATLLGHLSLLTAPDLPAWVPGAVTDGAGTDSREAVDELVRARLLEVRGRGQDARYRLHDLVRDFARERVEDPLGAAATSAVRRVLGGWIALVAQLPPGLDGFVPDASLAHRLAPAHLQTVRTDPSGWTRRELAGLVAAVEQAGALGLTRHAWNLAAGLTGQLQRMHEQEAWARMDDAALAACLEAGDDVGAARVRYGRGLAALNHDDHAQALTHLRAAADTFERYGLSRPAAHALGGVGAALRITGAYPGAEVMFRAALRQLEAVDDPVGLAYALDGLGAVLIDTGRPAEAVPYLEQSLAVVRRGGRGHPEALAMRALAVLYRNLGRLDDAATLFTQTIALAEEVEGGFLGGLSRQGLAEVRLAQGRLSEAAQEAGLALQMGTRLAIPRVMALARRTLGRVALARGDLREAAEQVDRAVSLWREHGMPVWVARGLVDLGDVADAGGDAAAAVRFWAQAADLFRTLGSREVEQAERRIAGRTQELTTGEDRAEWGPGTAC